jgi:hypothetical protein
MKLEGWNIIDEDAGILWREYSFAKKATATALVFRGADGLVVVSPPRGLEARDYDALRELGDVRALVANNSFHHMGQAAWRARFPDAVSYCPPRAIDILKKKSGGVAFRPLSELALAGGACFEEPPGYKTGEAILRLPSRRGSLWFTGDLLTNIPQMPGPMGWFMSWFDAAPGFKLFTPAVWHLVKDRKAVRAWALQQLAVDPPAIVVSAHGPPVDVGDVAALAKAQLERL